MYLTETGYEQTEQQHPQTPVVELRAASRSAASWILPFRQFIDQSRSPLWLDGYTQ